jgi:hypothetical protein
MVPGLKFKLQKSVSPPFGTVTPTALTAVSLIILPARTNFLPNDEEFFFFQKKRERKKERKKATPPLLWKTRIEEHK